MIDRGSIVFVKDKIALTEGRGATSIGLKKPIATMVLGITDKESKWDDKLVTQSLVTLGLFYGDDIAEALGDENHKKLVKFIEKKYKD